MARTVHIGDRAIGEEYPVFIVAEVSCNHLQQKEKAAAIIEAASKAGADAIKLQTYTPDTMTIDSDKAPFRVGGENNPDSWKGVTLYNLYEKAYTPWEWQPELKTLANKLGMMLFSTPFDPTAVTFLEKEVGVPCHKIASYELTDDTLLEAVAKTGKPVIISNGYATLEELEHAAAVLEENGAQDIVILYCVTEYAEGPTTDGVNLATIGDIEKRFGVVVGFSDNNGGIELPIMAVLTGAHVVEKHLILSHSDKSYDQRFSIDPQEFTEMVGRIRIVEGKTTDEKMKLFKRIQDASSWFGVPTYGPTSKTEEYNRRWRRSLFAVADIKKGDKLMDTNIRSIRPEGGLAPRHYHEVLGRTAANTIERGTPLSWDMIL